MNSFELRQSKRRDKRKKQREDRAFTATLEAVGVQSFFEDAFNTLYGRKPKLIYKSGWFYLQGKRICKDALMQEARQLHAKLNEQGVYIT